jgi:hypothetical protein
LLHLPVAAVVSQSVRPDARRGSEQQIISAIRGFGALAGVEKDPGFFAPLRMTQKSNDEENHTKRKSHDAKIARRENRATRNSSLGFFC